MRRDDSEDGYGEDNIKRLRLYGVEEAGADDDDDDAAAASCGGGGAAADDDDAGGAGSAAAAGVVVMLVCSYSLQKNTKLYWSRSPLWIMDGLWMDYVWIMVHLWWITESPN